MPATKIAQLERMIMDLGAELYKLRHEVGILRDYKHQSSLAMGCIRSILKERGFVDDEGFDLAVDMAQLTDPKSPDESADRGSKFPRKLAN